MTTSTVAVAEMDLSSGVYMKGIKLSSDTFLAATSFQQLRTITRDPEWLQPGSKRGNDDPEIQDERAMHELIQRALAGNKKSNVPRYSRYIEGLVRGDTPGVLPPMHLWTASALDVVTSGVFTYVLVPHGEHLFAIDGETQLSAHHALARSGTLDKGTHLEHQRFPLGAIVHHGIPTRIARQYFHDLNILAVRPNTSLGLAMDTQDPIMKVVADVESNVELLAGHVEKMSRQLPRKSPRLLTLQSLRQMVVDVAKGISGIQYGARPAPVDDVDVRELTAVATDWVEAYFTTFEHAIRDRDRTLAGSGPVLAAIGAIGHELLLAAADERSALLDTLMARLATVDWTKGEHWRGIAGDYTAGGVFSVKGTKEVAYAVYNALTDPANPGYSQIRGGGTARPGQAPVHPPHHAAPAIPPVGETPVVVGWPEDLVDDDDTSPPPATAPPATFHAQEP